MPVRGAGPSAFLHIFVSNAGVRSGPLRKFGGESTRAADLQVNLRLHEVNSTLLEARNGVTGSSERQEEGSLRSTPPPANTLDVHTHG